jgi:class 3 adenylate cyclase
MAMESDKRKGNAMMAPNHRLKTFLDGNVGDESEQPIADFFPNCTVMFADIGGFTAWSSTREPTQVFVLLQTVYQNFDFLAKRRKVFKVETTGDSYLAVTGLPEPQSHHATIMGRFAWDCLLRMSEITKELEVTLGPDTGKSSER